MDYTPVTAVWEITMGCNMRCGHCGSACAEPMPDELTTEEALRVCDEMKAVGLKWITLSGGEPLTRKDWPVLARRLSSQGVIPNLITNGWLLTEEMVRTAGECGVETISISLDGTRESHDALRKKGSFDRVLEGFQVLSRIHHVSSANTTITRRNLPELEAIKAILIEHRVQLWQIQIGLPMGNMKEHREDIIDPSDIDALLDFAYRTTLEGRIKVFPADCLGYFTEREQRVRQWSTGSPVPVAWQGCNAGKRSFGLLHNGDVLGCTSIRDRQFVEGNVRERSLMDIWQHPNAFAWSRNLRKSDLAGACAECHYGEVCLGGCPNTRLTLNGSIHSENAYCAYNHALGETRQRLAGYGDVAELGTVAQGYVGEGKLQLAALTLQRALELAPEDLELLALYGYVSFAMGNFATSLGANERVLAQQPEHAYALKGKGLCLHKLGQGADALACLRRAAELAEPHDMDAHFDWSVVCHELGQPGEALEALHSGERKSPGFLARVGPFYHQLLAAAGGGASRGQA